MDLTPHHRIFSLAWSDFFHGLPITVQPELDLSMKVQRLDLAFVGQSTGPLPCRLPDGFGPLAQHNLITFKSQWEPLDCWALTELLGHYVNYRKQLSPTSADLLPESAFHLYAVSVRYPRDLAREVLLNRLQEGVYDTPSGAFSKSVRLIVVQQLPRVEHNALLHLFSANQEAMRYGSAHYRRRSMDTSTLLLQLWQSYPKEDQAMWETLEQLKQETIKELFQRMSVEERLKGLSPEERLKDLSPEERLKDLTPEEVLAALPAATQEALAQRLKERGTSLPS